MASSLEMIIYLLQIIASTHGISFMDIIIYLTPILIGTLMAVIGDRLGLSEFASEKATIKREAPVTKVKGIGEATAKALKKSKINTVDDFVKGDVKKIAKATGMDKKTVKKLVKFALKAMLED
ncbi:MAG: helix-hairpin-helix domain-containing protein [Candidatus Lokiarchaeia archaeon]